MTPEKRADDIITWTMPDTARRRLAAKIAAHIRAAEVATKERCAAKLDELADIADKEAAAYGIAGAAGSVIPQRRATDYRNAALAIWRME